MLQLARSQSSSQAMFDKYPPCRDIRAIALMPTDHACLPNLAFGSELVLWEQELLAEQVI
jgi:hypothetical protein